VVIKNYQLFNNGGLVGIFILGGIITLIIFGINEIIKFHNRRIRALNQNGNLNVQLLDQP
jgi:hypothetical protein